MASSAADVDPVRPVDRARSTGAALGLIWLAVTTVGLVALDARATYGARVTADEPQYLLTALSLAEDLDLDIADELAEERFRPFHRADLSPQTIELNRSGQRLSPHDPLLPAILAPATAVGGWIGAKTTLAGLAGATAALTAWVANRRLGIGATTAAVVVTGFFVSPPLVTYATQVYPEMPAALAVVAGLAGVLPGPDRRRAVETTRVAVVVAAVVALPWLSVKYVPLAAVLTGALLVNHRERLRRGDPTRTPEFAAVITVLVAAGLLYLVVHRRVYGGWTVYVVGDHFVGGEFEVVGTDPNYPARTRRLIGLLVDRRFGLAPWAPAYLLAVPAVAAVARRRTWPRGLLFSLIGASWFVATWVALTMHGWWWPGRQVVAVLPLVVLSVAGLVDGHRRAVAAVAAASTAALVNWLWLVVEASTDRRTLIVDFFDTRAPVYRLLAPFFPDHAANGPLDRVLTVMWVVVAAAAVGVLARPGPGVGTSRDEGPSLTDRG